MKKLILCFFITMVILGCYDEQGYDSNGWNKDKNIKTNKYTGSLYDKKGYDINGWSEDKDIKINKYTGSLYDKEGYDKEGYDKEGYNKSGYNRSGYNREGYDINGWNKDKDIKINKYTGSLYDKEGYDKEGYDKEGYNKSGYDRNGYDKIGYDKKGYDVDGYNIEGYDKQGYDVNGWSRNKNIKINKYTGKLYDKEGYDINGWSIYNNKSQPIKAIQMYKEDKNYIYNNMYQDEKSYSIINLYDKEGYDINGWSKDKNIRSNKYTGNLYDKEGYDISGWNKDKNIKINKYTGSLYDTEGYDIDGCDINGYNKNKEILKNFNEDIRINKYTGNLYDKEGYNINGWNKDKNIKINKYTEKLYDTEGYDINGKKILQKEEFYKMLMSVNYYLMFNPEKIQKENLKKLLDRIKTINDFMGSRKNKYEKTNFFIFRKTKAKEELNKLNKSYYLLQKNVEMSKFDYNADLEEIDINLAQDIFNDEIYSYLRTYKLYPKNKIKLENFKIKLTPEEAMNNSIQIRYLITDINIQREISTYELKGYQIYYRNKIIKERYF